MNSIKTEETYICYPHYASMEKKERNIFITAVISAIATLMTMQVTDLQMIDYVILFFALLFIVFSFMNWRYVKGRA